MSSPRRLLATAAVTLHAAGIASPEVDAELLLAGVLGVPRGELVRVDEVAVGAAARFDEFVARRAGREPLQHILGTAVFRFRELAVGPGVFVPRPETELLIDAVLPHLSRRRRPVVVDLCSGTGALALAVATEAAGTRVVAVEHAPSALTWLRRNAVHTPVRVVDGSVTDPDLLTELRGQVDVVVANPPYVPTTTAVQPEVRADPHEAVFAGRDGLAVIPHVLARAGELLRPGGMVAIEHDDSQAEAVPELLRQAGHWREIADHHDLTGRPRYATALHT